MRAKSHDDSEIVLSLRYLPLGMDYSNSPLLTRTTRMTAMTSQYNVEEPTWQEHFEDCGLRPSIVHVAIVATTTSRVVAS